MIAKSIFIFGILLIVCNPCRGGPEDPIAYAAWETKWLDGVSEAKAAPPEEAIPRLGLWVYQVNLPENREREGRPVFTAVRDALVAIPGHATYYEQRIKEARERMNAESDPNLRSPLTGNYRNEQRMGFEILSYLPSPETVRVLGDFLFDERERVAPSPPGRVDDEVERQRLTGLNWNSNYALRAISNLPLVFKPIRREPFPSGIRGDYPEDLQPWRLWYEQVKAGTRTFRFEGDPQEYSLNGPVVGARMPATERPAKGAAPLPGAVEEEKREDAPSRWLVVALVGALVLCGVAAWRAVRDRTKRS